MSKLLSFIFILTLLLSCKSEEKPPTLVLSKSKLTEFLVEMYLAEARADLMPIPRDSSIKLFMPYEDELMKRYNLTDSLLKVTYQYYTDHPKDMEQVYDAVIDSLSLREQSIKR